jgi:hypothetical protein
MQNNLIVEANRAAESFDRARENNEAEAAERAAKNFLDHMMSLENPFPEEANTISDPSTSANATGLGQGFEDEKARLVRKKEEVEKYLQELSRQKESQ